MTLRKWRKLMIKLFRKFRSLFYKKNYLYTVKLNDIVIPVEFIKYPPRKKKDEVQKRFL